VDGGDWHEVTEGLPNRDGTAMGTLTTNEAEPGVFYYFTVPGEVYRSEDGGQAWGHVTCGWAQNLPRRDVRAAAAAEG
jgi:hypothetical protein